jgi:hypothetical protein
MCWALSLLVGFKLSEDNLYVEQDEHYRNVDIDEKSREYVRTKISAGDRDWSIASVP